MQRKYIEQKLAPLRATPEETKPSLDERGKDRHKQKALKSQTKVDQMISINEEGQDQAKMTLKPCGKWFKTTK